MPEHDKQTGVMLEGRFYPVDDEASWKIWRAFFDEFFRWQQQKPRPPVIEPEQQPQNQAPIAANVARKWTRNEPGTRSIDSLLLALDAHGGKLTYRDALNIVPTFGWDTSVSSNPGNMVRTRARLYPELIQMENGLYTLLPKGKEIVEQIKTKYGVVPANKPEDTSM